MNFDLLAIDFFNRILGTNYQSLELVAPEESWLADFFELGFCGTHLRGHAVMNQWEEYVLRRIEEVYQVHLIDVRIQLLPLFHRIHDVISSSMLSLQTKPDESRSVSNISGFS